MSCYKTKARNSCRTVAHTDIPFRLACCVCGGIVAPPGTAPADARKVLCLACLARFPDAPFGERLKSCRVAAGLTRRDLATWVGLPRNTLWSYEAGTREPRSGNLLSLIRVLGEALVMPDTVPWAPGAQDWRSNIMAVENAPDVSCSTGA